ncbi:hypothetical protein J2793_004064 [Paraburkholderia caledonica]|uniref:Uncharacterized protein n=1 Tax=Paraburkholderia caledonica TaxID=134536 RepID=A0AB73IF38_9BURK|nr:hypothetical protein [Paraburkholderia caledonica]
MDAELIAKPLAMMLTDGKSKSEKTGRWTTKGTRKTLDGFVS